MAQTVILARTWTLGTTSVSQTNNYADEAVTQLDIDVDTGESDQETTYALDVSELKVLYMVADQDMTLYTNANDGAGGDTFGLIAGEPVIWTKVGEETTVVNPFSADVTALFLNNTSGTNGTFKLRELHDTTPPPP